MLQKVSLESLGLSDAPTDSEERGETVIQGAFNADEIVAACKSDLNMLAAVAMPLVFKYFFPSVFLAIWQWVTEHLHKTRDFSQLAVGLPRGFGKTIVVKLLILYAILFTRKQYILVVSGNEDKAVSIISDVIGMLDEANIKAVFGDWRVGKSVEQQAKKVFAFRGRDIILKGVGKDGDVRGITENNRRPDFMIFDDIQSEKDSQSEVLSSELERWMVGTAMKAKDPEGCLFLFVANMYATKGSLLRKLKHNPNWLKFICGGITATGESLWEALQPITQLIREYQNDLAAGRPEIFYAEVLNDENASSNNLIDLSKIPEYPFQASEVIVGSFIVIDPATDKASADAVSIGVFDVIDTLPVSRKIIEGRFSPGETIRQALTLAINHNCCLIAVESNAYQYTLKYWFEQIMTQMGLTGITVVDIYSGVSSKNSRILTMFKSLIPSRVGIHPEIILHPDVRAQVSVQIMQFNPLRKDNTDGILDLLTYAPKVLEMYGTEILASSIIIQQEADSQEVIEFNSPF